MLSPHIAGRASLTIGQVCSPEVSRHLWVMIHVLVDGPATCARSWVDGRASLSCIGNSTDGGRAWEEIYAAGRLARNTLSFGRIVFKGGIGHRNVARPHNAGVHTL